ncbi:hypothetical protein KVV02_006120 [Mortierella alpina]|uniref:Uncharacterized protein n=1 Tax=Mortierella alpina TaxID=64518 RepID=A0A9P8AC74_MORAP|nr:hypothetical protein KVV02_006120 [Mortierella alpina]
MNKHKPDDPPSRDRDHSPMGDIGSQAGTGSNEPDEEPASKRVKRSHSSDSQSTAALHPDPESESTSMVGAMGQHAAEHSTNADDLSDAYYTDNNNRHHQDQGDGMHQLTEKDMTGDMDIDADPSYREPHNDGPTPSMTIPASTPGLETTAEEGGTNEQGDGIVTGSLLPEISLEERAELTVEVRKRSEHALAINRQFQEVLRKHLKEVEKARIRNRELWADVSELVDKYERTKRAPVVLPKARLGPPYFIDKQHEVPPENADALRRHERPLVVHENAVTWTEPEREKLKKGVIAENRRMFIDQLIESGEAPDSLPANAVSEIDLMLNTKGLDWHRISEQFVVTRNASECLIQWTGQDHPGINKREWSKEEIAKLDEMASKHHERNWVQIALDLATNRTAAQCLQKYRSRMTKMVSKELWTEEEDNILAEAVRLLGERNWQQISYCLENRNAGQCMIRWSKTLNPTIRRGRWLPEEDGVLRAAVAVYGAGRWSKIQQHVLGRTDVQCRERYMNVLAPTVKAGPWTEEELQKLQEHVAQYGKQWAKIASLMDGRTDNQVARRWKLMCRDEKRKNEGKAPRPYLASGRRPGRTTMAVVPNLEKHREAIRRSAEKLRRKEIILQNKMARKEQVRQRAAARQEKELRNQYECFLRRQRAVYDLWESHWGKYVDPIEKVFNLGIPPKLPRTEDSGERPSEQEQQQVHEQEQEKDTSPSVQNRDNPEEGDAEAKFDIATITNPQVPEPSSTLQPGKVRPVPPCVATLEAFEKLVEQGQHSESRFQITQALTPGGLSRRQLTTLPLNREEQQQPEFVELAERFEAVFTWPMMMGMLHMGFAREVVGPPSAGRHGPLSRMSKKTSEH